MIFKVCIVCSKELLYRQKLFGYRRLCYQNSDWPELTCTVVLYIELWFKSSQVPEVHVFFVSGNLVNLW